MLCGERVGGTSTRAPSLGLVEGSSLKLERGEQPGTLQIFLLLQHTGGRGWMLDSHSLRPMKSRCSREPSNLRIPGGVWRVETGERIPKKWYVDCGGAGSERDAEARKRSEKRSSVCSLCQCADNYARLPLWMLQRGLFVPLVEMEPHSWVSLKKAFVLTSWWEQWEPLRLRFLCLPARCSWAEEAPQGCLSTGPPPPSPLEAPQPARCQSRWEREKKIIMCDLMPASQPPEKMGKMKKLRRTLSESFRSIGEYRFPFSSLLFIKTQKTDVKCLLQQLRPPLPTEMMSAHSLRPWKTHISGLVRVFKHCAPHFEGKLQICQVSELLWGFSSRLSAADQRGSHFSTNGH